MKGCICLTFATPDFTGACKMGYYFAKSFSESDYKVVAVCGPRPDSGEPSVIDYLRDIGVTTVETDNFSGFSSFNAVKTITEFTRKENVNAIISLVQMDIKVAALISKITGIPLVYSAQNITHFNGKALIRKLKAILFGQLIKRCVSLSICTSLIVKNEIVENFGARERNTWLLPNGIDVSVFPSFADIKIRAIREGFGVASDDMLFINVGRLDQQKGQTHLLRAFAKARFSKPAKLLLVGGTSYGGKTGISQSNSYAESLYRFVDDSGLRDRVIFAGWRNDIPLLLSSADVYVHSSVREGPALPLAILEAMSAKLPVIGTDCSGHPRGFQNGVHGHIVPKGKSGPITEAMEKMVAMDFESRQSMGKAARSLVEKYFDINEIAKKFVGIVERKLLWGLENNVTQRKPHK